MYVLTAANCEAASDSAPEKLHAVLDPTGTETFKSGVFLEGALLEGAF